MTKSSTSWLPESSLKNVTHYRQHSIFKLRKKKLIFPLILFISFFIMLFNWPVDLFTKEHLLIDQSQSVPFFSFILKRINLHCVNDMFIISASVIVFSYIFVLSVRGNPRPKVVFPLSHSLTVIAPFFVPVFIDNKNRRCQIPPGKTPCNLQPPPFF